MPIEDVAKRGMFAGIADSIGSSTHVVIFGRLLAVLSKSNFDPTGKGATGHAHSGYFVVAGVREVLHPYIYACSLPASLAAETSQTG